MEVTQAPEERLTRAKVLKRVGIGAAAVWTVPMFVTTSSAYAGEGKRCADLATQLGRGACTSCGGEAFCDQNLSGNCNCFVNDKGCCHCQENLPGGCDSPRCATQRDCPRGSTCVRTCCDGAGQRGKRCLRNCRNAPLSGTGRRPSDA